MRWQFEEFDTDDPDFSVEYRLYDSLLRPVRLKITLMHTLEELSLADDIPSPEAMTTLQITQLVRAQPTEEQIYKFEHRWW